jgi:hypothetical protein
MPAYTNSFIVIPARLLPASLTCIRPSQLDAWPKADSGQHHSGWLRQAGCRASGPGPPIRVSSAGPVSLSRQGVSCTATQCHLSSFNLIAGSAPSIGQECTTTSAPPRPASQPLQSRLSRVPCRGSESAQQRHGGGGHGGAGWTDVTNLQVEE